MIQATVTKRWFLPGVVLTIGVIVTLWMQVYTQAGVFFSGDAGLKALLAQQFASGNWQVDLQLTDQDWIKQLWQAGLYPFSPPFVYAQGDKHFITFPFTFPGVTAPFYALIGYHGLYLVPLVSLWLLWWRFYQLTSQRLHPMAVGLSLVGLVLASPLLPYAAMYWEHTLAVTLAFWGFSLILFSKDAQNPSLLPIESSLLRLTIAGSLIGLSVWFRPEFLCFVAALSAVMVLSWLKPKWLGGFHLRFRAVMTLIAAMSITIAIFFGINQALYGHSLGIHAIQVVEESSLKQQLLQARASYQQLFTALFRYFPITLLALATPALPWIDRNFKLPASSRVLLLVGVLFAIAVPLMTPPGAGGKQWACRFYLILIPMILLILVPMLDTLYTKCQGKIRALGLAAVALLLAFSLHMNLVNSSFREYQDSQTRSTSLVSNFVGMSSASTALKFAAQPWIAISHQYIAQHFWASNRDRTFFLTETPEAMKKLASGLMAQDISEFLYICYSQRCPIPNLSPESLRFSVSQHSAQIGEITFKPAGTFGPHHFYNVKLR